jgi:hypothetical protein
MGEIEAWRDLIELRAFELDIDRNVVAGHA